ncbi:MAG: hypothetical protein CEO22_254 [Candidatus Berkelbacteria bacterium Gr01-1014_85]|uniref:G5 domain-containing protein n=1 Tax=Candidatus Berkelbacteria bacterium Gr01-1014_85 TaxID=2017150 RepID=A0A554JCM0_9BACT|nr:MAG: hypothetical protein CEO22_254 [Candidatus Berkelbacteria bacterium Gr01-1014_85]
MRRIDFLTFIIALAVVSLASLAIKGRDSADGQIGLVAAGWQLVTEDTGLAKQPWFNLAYLNPRRWQKASAIASDQGLNSALSQEPQDQATQTTTVGTDRLPLESGVYTDRSTFESLAAQSLYPLKELVLPIGETLPRQFVEQSLLEQSTAAQSATEQPSNKLDRADIILAQPDPRIGLGSRLTVARATRFTIIDYGKKIHLVSLASTPRQLLSEQGLTLGENDKIDRAVDRPMTKADLDPTTGQIVLTITRVAITEVKESETIAFEQIKKEDPTLPRGEIKQTPGQLGERRKTFRVTRENGREVKRELIKNELIKAPQPEITIVGTKVVVGKVYTGRVSWYKYNSTKVASDLFKRGVTLRLTNLNNGQQIIVRNDGCICADTGFLVDLHPDHFTALGGTLRQGVLQNVKVEEIINP